MISRVALSSTRSTLSFLCLLTAVLALALSFAGTAHAADFNGTNNADILSGTAFGDHINGNNGNDHLWGHRGRDILKGGDGNDVLKGGAGKDRIIGGDGDDIILARDKKVDRIFCGPGTDTVMADATDILASDCENIAGTTGPADAPDPAPTPTVALTVSTVGTGDVTSSTGAINCGLICTDEYAVGSTVTFTATAGTGYTFAGWSGAGCSGTDTCVVTVSAADSVTATFTVISYLLTVSPAGAGTGTVTSTPAGINCGATCSNFFAIGSVLTLTASPAIGSTFSGWSGSGCSGTGICVVTMNSAMDVTATFVPAAFALTVSRAGAGSGTVTSAPSGINCGATCASQFVNSSIVSLTASSSVGSTFTGWSGGGCSGAGSCAVTMDAAKSVTATFALNNYSLTVSKSGSGTGTVTSSPAGIDCGATCTLPFAFSTVVTLTAVPDASWDFGGWSGPCSGISTCIVTMDSAKTVNAAFDPM
ncbi:MAG: hypothetical protein JHC87_03525 [Thermoleophilaceae bacterium]|nr:hypothetical protein [Thermoleophilaceae bacterium]